MWVNIAYIDFVGKGGCLNNGLKHAICCSSFPECFGVFVVWFKTNGNILG